MNDTSTTPLQADKTLAFDSPGQLLRAKRKECKLSIENIAEHTHLDIKIIEAIEADDYSNMSSTVYVRGYLRCYAKTVNIDPDKVIELYNKDTPSSLPDILPEVSFTTQASSSDKPVKAITYLVSLSLVLLLLIWYQSDFVMNTTEETIIQSEPIGNEVNTTEGTIIQSEPIGNEVNTTEETIIQSESVNEPNIGTENLMDPIHENINNTSVEKSDEELLNKRIINEINSSVSTHLDSIILTLTKDSWIEIYNDNKRIFAGLGKLGERHVINGIAPFNIILGVADGVKVEFNGEIFDTIPYARNGVARFKLPLE